jgi:tetratricopeptide (TPR) repeat protein
MRAADLFKVAFLGAIIALSAGSVSSQTRVNTSGTGGIHTIQGRIFLPSGKTPDRQIRVELQSSNYPSLSVETDINGSFVFRNLSPGNYSVVVDLGESFEVAREYVMIDTDVLSSRRSAGSKTFTVPVHLQQKRRGYTRPPGVLDATLASLPKDAVEHYERGMDLLANDETDSAVREFEQALGVYPRFTQCHVELGKAHLKNNKLPDAVNSLRTALNIEPENFDARLHLGVALMNGGKFEDAEKELVTAAYLNRRAVTPHYYLGVMYIEKKDLNIAQKALETAKELKGTKSFPLLHKYLGGVYMAKRLNAQAAVELEAYLDQDPDAKDADRIKATISELKKKN